LPTIRSERHDDSQFRQEYLKLNDLKENIQEKSPVLAVLFCLWTGNSGIIALV